MGGRTVKFLFKMLKEDLKYEIIVCKSQQTCKLYLKQKLMTTTKGEFDA